MRIGKGKSRTMSKRDKETMSRQRMDMVKTIEDEGCPTCNGRGVIPVPQEGSNQKHREGFLWFQKLWKVLSEQPDDFCLGLVGTHVVVYPVPKEGEFVYDPKDARMNLGEIIKFETTYMQVELDEFDDAEIAKDPKVMMTRFTSPENVEELEVPMIDPFEEATDVKPEGVLGPRLKVGPNDACPCGSGKKHKKCCMDKAV